MIATRTGEVDEVFNRLGEEVQMINSHGEAVQLWEQQRRTWTDQMEGQKRDLSVGGLHEGMIRASDHQFIQPLYVSVMERVGGPGVPHDNEGSGFGFRTVRYFEPRQTEQPTTCQMQRPEGL